MSAGVETASARWLRVAKIVGLFVVMGPLVAATGLFVGNIIEGLSNPRYTVTFANAPSIGRGWLAVAFMAGAPYALLTGGAFALLAVFAGWSALWVAIAAALAPMPFIHLLPPVGTPIWQMGSFFVVVAIVVLVASASVCWYLSRPWHGKP